MRFDGSAAFLLGGLLNVPRITWAAWVRPRAIGVRGHICGHQDTGTGANEKNLFLQASGQWYFNLYDGNSRNVTGTSVAKAGVWYHVAGTADGSQIHVTVDGKREASSVGGAGYTTYTGVCLRIGGGTREGGSAPEYYFDGEIARVRRGPRR